MRPRLAWLLLLLGLTLIGAWILARQRKALAQQQQARVQASFQRYSELEAQALNHEETTWKSLQGATSADAWWATAADAVAASSNGWPTLLAFLGSWPTLAPLHATAARDHAAGWTLARMTVRPFNVSGELPTSGQSLHQLELLLARGNERARVRAFVAVQHPPPTNGDAPITDWAPIQLELRGNNRSEGRIQFELWAEFTPSIPTNTYFVDPLLYHETVNGPELLLVSTRQRWRFEQQPTASNSGTGKWIPGPALEGIPPDRAVAAAMADVDLDGRSELCLAGRDGLWIARGQDRGEFEMPILRWRSPEPLIYPQSVALADIDHDGDLDLWITQYKNPYQKGQFPTPYYDANDGFNSYLLRNDGGAGFTDATTAAGLQAKRRRRTYSASLLDLNGDGSLDLVNVSDFAGLDVYRNDGRGHFVDVTPGLGAGRHAFGMAHSLIDWNGDAFPDVLVVGMDSPWAARLNAMNLGRPDFPEHSRMRAAMTWGSRVFIGSRTGLQLESSEAANSLAKAGWAWGGAELDIENDGRSDFFFATGHETRASQRDYERQFWLHDIYTAGSTNDPAVELYFQAATGRRLADKASYGGWQHQALLRRTSDTNGFEESAWLAGVGLLADGRNALAADFDGDGRVDLAVTTVEGWPQVRQRLVIFRNVASRSGHWIGLRFREGPGRKSAVNSRIEIHTDSGIRRRWPVTGEGYRMQQTVQAHFGLGTNRVVRKAAVIWADGTRTELNAPSPDRWHEVP